MTEQVIQLSNSTLNVLNGCARKFQHLKINRHPNLYNDREASIHTAYGKAVGSGIASYLVHQDMDLARHEAFKEWDYELWEKLHGKFFSSALEGINRFVPKAKKILAEYDVAEFSGKPATELGFKINVKNTDFTYVGFIDAVLQHKETGKYLNLEAKTMNQAFHPSKFQNSNQDLGYLAITALTETVEMTTMYPILMATAQDLSWVCPKYDRTQKDLDGFISTLQLEIIRIQNMLQVDFFPKNGEACFNYGRICPMYLECDKDFTPQPVVEQDYMKGKSFSIEAELDLGF